MSSLGKKLSRDEHIKLLEGAVETAKEGVKWWERRLEDAKKQKKDKKEDK